MGILHHCCVNEFNKGVYVQGDIVTGRPDCPPYVALRVLAQLKLVTEYLLGYVAFLQAALRPLYCILTGG